MLFGLLAATAFAQSSSDSGGTSTLDFEFFKARVQPILLAKREGHARCYVCHSNGTPYRLQKLSPGASSWNEEQARKNFTATSAMINTRDPEASPLLIYPLKQAAGGNKFHPGGKHWDSKDAQEWKTLDEFAHGRKLSASSK